MTVFLFMLLALIAGPWPIGAQTVEERAQPERFGLAAEAVEIPAARTAYSKRFRVGDRFVEVVRGRPMHYRDPVLGWRDNVAAFRQDGAELVADTLPFAVRAGGGADCRRCPGRVTRHRVCEL